MKGKVIWLSVVAVVVSFIGGFLLANALNRSEINNLKAESERLKNSPNAAKQTDSEAALSDEEIRARIAEADQNPKNFAFQKNLGLALYRYAAMRQDADLLNEVARLLTRAYENDSKDYDVVVALGNLYFDIGYYKKQNAPFERAREFYSRALEQKPADVDVRTDYGLSYFLMTPPEADRAIAEFQKSLQTNPRHEKTLQVLAQTLISQNKKAEAETYLARLREVNANNQYLPELENQISQSKQ